MALETGTYINALDAANPVTGDQLSQADDHLRWIKSAILASFPNITGAMTATHTILNGLDARATALEGAYVAKDGSVALTGTWDASGATWSDLGAVTTADINGGSIDGTIIGAASAAAGTFAALVGTTLNATGAATFGSTVLLNANPTLDLQAATKLYVDDRSAVAPFVDGLTLSNNVTDATNDIDIEAGSIPDTTRAKVLTLASGITKQLNAVWAVGTNAGGLDTGTFALDSAYHAWIIMRSDTGVVDVLFSLSGTAPTMPTNYDYKQRIGAVCTDGSIVIRPFVQTGPNFRFVSEILDVSGTNNNTSTRGTKVLSLPLGIPLLAHVRFWITDAASQVGIITALDTDDLDPLDTLGVGHSKVSYGQYGTPVTLDIMTDPAASVGVRVESNVNDLRIYTLGWHDPRGMW
jgi:hypothetical protein